MDEIFDAYLSRPGVRQPILTQYCDGRQVSCEGWMTQWGSCDLGKQGYSPIEILRYFYGDSIYINTAEQISGIPASWPGSDLSQGSSGSKVRQLQEQLDAIATVYTAIPRVAPDGIYGPPHCGCSAGIPEHLRPSPDRSGGFCYLVPDFPYLCGNYQNGGAGVGTVEHVKNLGKINYPFLPK